MALKLMLEDDDLTNKVLWDECTFEEVADEGTVGQGTVVLRDIDASLTPRPNNTVRLYDRGNLAWGGGAWPLARGRDTDVDHYGVRRVHRLTILDQNRLLDNRRAEDIERDAESDVTRVRYVMTHLRPTVGAVTYVPDSATVTMDESDFRDQMLRDVIADCAETAGKDYWIDRDRELHYAVPGSLGSNLAAFSLSDDPTQYAANIFATPVPTVFNIGEIERTEDPNAVPLQNSILLKYGDDDPPDSVLVEDSTSIAQYGRIEGPPVYDERAKGPTSATNRANALLQLSRDPEVSYNTTIALPYLDLIRAGQWVSCTSQHQGLSNTKLKIASWSAKRKSSSSGIGYWEVEIELNKPVRIRRRRKGFRRGGRGPGGSTECCPPWDGAGSPDPGEDVFNELVFIGDSTTVDGTTDFPYQTGSLRIWVAGLNVAGHWTETDPSAGEFTLDFAPTAGQTVRVDYTAA